MGSFSAKKKNLKNQYGSSFRSFTTSSELTYLGLSLNHVVGKLPWSTSQNKLYTTWTQKHNANDSTPTSSTQVALMNQRKWEKRKPSSAKFVPQSVCTLLISLRRLPFILQGFHCEVIHQLWLLNDTLFSHRIEGLIALGIKAKWGILAFFFIFTSNTITL